MGITTTTKRKKNLVKNLHDGKNLITKNLLIIIAQIDVFGRDYGSTADNKTVVSFCKTHSKFCEPIKLNLCQL